MDVQPTITAAIGEHLTVIQQLTAMSSLILRVASELVATLQRQGKVVLCGNGGSASDAQHIAAEMQGIRAHPGTPQGLLALVLTENTALFTGSQFIFLTDDSGVGNAHGEPHIPFYHVQKLDKMMTRMIAAELSGKRIEPEKGEIIRTVGRPIN